MIEIFTSVAPDCLASPVTLTEWRTSWVNGTPYAADGVKYTISVSTVSVTYIYNDLFLPILIPGEIITQVLHLVVECILKYRAKLGFKVLLLSVLGPLSMTLQS